MSKMQAVIRKTLKAILWVALSFVLLFLIVAIIIQIPAVQTRIVHYATSMVSDKTHTKVELKRISISFPKSVVVEGLYLEDLRRDTLVYAGKATVNVSLFALLSNQIDISSLGLEDATVKLYSSATDPLFNYNFLLTAFSDTTLQAKTPNEPTQPWTFSLGDVSLKNVRFTYRDVYAGISVFASLKDSKFSVKTFDPEKSVYQFNRLTAESLMVKVLRNATGHASASNNSESISPRIGAQKLQLNHSAISYIDSVSSISVISGLAQADLDDVALDLQAESLNVDKIDLRESRIQFHTFAPETTANTSTSTSENNWKVAVKHLDATDNTWIYQSGNNPETKGNFNPEQIVFSRLRLEARDFLYSAALTKVSVQAFSATDQNNFEIKNLETDFSMDEHSITAQKLKASTSYSTVDADFSLRYSSLTALTDSMQFTNLSLALRSMALQNADVLYFKPDLVQQPFFRNKGNMTTASGTISGPVNHLSGKNLLVKTGRQTSVQTNFSISGLPNYKTANYDFPKLKITSGKKDLEWLAAPYIPDSLAIPEQISLDATFKGRISQFESAVTMNSSFGSAKLTASVDPDENFSSRLSVTRLDLGRLMKDSVLYGPVSLTADVAGKGLDLNTHAKVKAEATELYLNRYTYHNLTLEGTASGQQLEGKINLNDENAVFDMDGLANLNPGQEHYQLKLNVQGADLKKLKLTEKDIRLSFVTKANFTGGSASPMRGTAGISDLFVARDGKKFTLGSVLSASINQPESAKAKDSGGLIDLKYTGTVSPVDLPHLLSQFVNQYFPLADSVQQAPKNEQANFAFEIQVHNHPILSNVLLPDLIEFEPGVISGSFDSRKNELKLIAGIRKLVYGGTEVNDFAVNVNSENNALNYRISGAAISNSQIRLDNVLLDGKLANNQIVANLSSTSGNNRKLLIRSLLTKEHENYKLTIDPNDFYLVNNRWNIAADNSIEFGKQGFRIHNFFIGHNQSSIRVASVNDRFNDDLNIAIANFRLDDFSRIVEKDTALVKGTVDGNVLMKRVADSYGLISDLTVNKLVVHEVPIGNLSLKASRLEPNKFDLNLNLSGSDNNLTATGYLVPGEGQNTMHLKTEIQSLSMKTIEAFSMGQISEASGILSGNILADGALTAPDISGELVFRNVFLKPSFLNSRLELKNETIQLKNDGVYFQSFTLLDRNQHAATINGSVQMKQFADLSFALQVNATDFVLFNTTAKDNKEFFGRMVIDSKVNVSGPMSLPVVNGRVKLKKGSSFTFSVPEDQLTTDKGEDVVEFSNPQKMNPILSRGDQKSAQSSGISGFDLSSIIEIDKEATLRLLMDPASTDSLVVKGEAALSFTMDQSGKMSLTGAYNLNEGSYLVSLESVIKKRFDIEAGSTIVWNGDPMDATISINATYTVRASPIDLMANELTNQSEADKGGYKQRYPFLVLLKLRGEILRPEISFEIQLSPEDKGILDGAVNQKLSALNEDESALNKQVFALLVLGRFIQENPFQSESGIGTSSIIRSTVSKFLSAQLNQLGSKVIPGMELNFDVQSYEDYQTGTAKGRTQVEIGVKQQLFNERLSVQLGGSVDVEGDRAKQNSASDITSDVTVEYKLTKDGRFRLKGFRHNQYEGAIEGQLVETGVGAVYVRDFNKWKRLFKKYKRTIKPELVPPQKH
jgi:hypothetical protein